MPRDPARYDRPTARVQPAARRASGSVPVWEIAVDEGVCSTSEGGGGGNLSKAGVQVRAGDRGRAVAGEGLRDGAAGKTADPDDRVVPQHMLGDRGAVGPVEVQERTLVI